MKVRKTKILSSVALAVGGFAFLARVFSA